MCFERSLSDDGWPGFLSIIRVGALDRHYRILLLINYQDSRRIPVFTYEDVKRSAGGGRIHHLESDTAPSQGEDQLTGRQPGLPAATENDDFRILCQEIGQVMDARVKSVRRVPPAVNPVPKKNDVFRQFFVADSDFSFLDMAHGDHRSGIAYKLHSQVLAIQISSLLILREMIVPDYFQVSKLCLFFNVASTGRKLTSAGKGRDAIVVLPPGGHGRVDDPGQARWLSRGTVSWAEPRSEILLKVLTLIGETAPSSLGALRYWGQCNERPDSWIAAADPVHLETRLHSLRMQSLRPDQLPESSVGSLFDHLQDTLGRETDTAFTRLGQHGYLCGQKPIDTASVSASVLHGLPPNEFIPSGESAVGYHQLSGEIQMALHDHDVNLKRGERGQPPINCLWLWGGGVAPQPARRPLPVLFANDPLFRGYWHSCMGEVRDWFADAESAVDDAPPAFVAVMPEFAPEVTAQNMTDYLGKLRQVLDRGNLRTLTLLFRDGLSVEISRWDSLRVWRPLSPLLKKTCDDD